MWLIRTIRGASRVFVFPLFLALALVAPKAYATNLLSNSDFEFDTSGWEEPFPDGNVIISHDTAFDHDSTPGVVGSLKLDISIDNGGARGPWQCVQVSPETLYSAAASVRRPTQSPVPFPSVELRYYSDASCTDFQGFHTGGSTHLSGWNLRRVVRHRVRNHDLSGYEECHLSASFRKHLRSDFHDCLLRQCVSAGAGQPSFRHGRGGDRLFIAGLPARAGFGSSQGSRECGRGSVMRPSLARERLSAVIGKGSLY